MCERVISGLGEHVVCMCSVHIRLKVYMYVCVQTLKHVLIKMLTVSFSNSSQISLK